MNSKFSWKPGEDDPEYEEYQNEEREKILRHMGIKKKFFDASFANLIDDVAFFKQRGFSKTHIGRYMAVKDVIIEIATGFEKHLEKGSCFIFTGPTGTGKDYFATCLLKAVYSNRELGEKMFERTGKRVKTLLVKLDDMMMHIKENLNKGERAAMREFSTPELLVINEIGIQNNTEFTWNKFQAIVDDRYADCLPTVFITNLTIEEFKELVGDRVISRCKEGLSEVIPFDWPDLRLGL